MENTIKRLLPVSTISGSDVVNHKGENIGTLEEIMIDTRYGHIAYVVLSFGGFMGLGDKLFAIPWNAFAINDQEEKLVLNIAKEKLEKAEGFNKDDWPNMADLQWGENIYSYYGYTPYWH